MSPRRRTHGHIAHGHRSRLPPAVVVLVLVAMIAGGCGSSGSPMDPAGAVGQSATSAAAAPSVSHSATSADAIGVSRSAPASSPRPASSASKAASVQTVVTILNFAYHAPTITVKAGTKVTWVNDDSSNHTVTADHGSFDLGNLNQGERGSIVFTKPGTYPYHCTYHPFMHGQVIVTR